jgi:hypothetical protein
MNNQTCNHYKDPKRDKILSRLHDSQKHPEWTRHKCATCAYMFGYDQGIKSSKFDCSVSKANEFDYSQIPDSQAGAGRHKCCICAFQRGFEAGQAMPDE